MQWRILMMNRAIVTGIAMAALMACHGTPHGKGAQSSTPRSEMRTIENVDPRPGLSDPPPMLHDEAAPPRPTGQPWEVKQPVLLTAQDDKIRAALPFAPAIAMDPIDGSKLSILANTPTLEHKGHIYYFSKEENKRTFAANPDQYSKGLFKGL